MSFNLSQSLTSLLQLTTASVAIKFLGMFMLAFYTRYLTKEELAILPVFEMLTGLTSIFFSFGIHPTLIRQLPALFKDDQRQATGLMHTGGLLLGLGSAMVAVLVFLLADWLSSLLFKTPDFSVYLRMLTLGFFFAANRNTCRFFLWAASRFDKLSVVEMVSALGRIIFAGGLLLAFGIKGLVIGLVINELVSLALSLYFLRDLLFCREATRYPMVGLVKESLPFYFEGFLIYFRSQGDNWIVATLMGPAMVSVYFVAKRLPSLLMMFVESLDKVVTTELSRRKADPEHINRYLQRYFFLFSHLLTPAILFGVGLAPVFILVVAGQGYSGAIIPSVILCLAQFLRILSIPLGRALFVTHPPLTRVYLTMFESVFLILGLWVLTPLLDANGVAISRVLASAAAFGSTLFVLKRSQPVGVPWKQVFLSLTPASIMCLGMLGLQQVSTSLGVVILGALGGILFFMVVVSLSNSQTFYATVSSVLPFRLIDPLRALFK